MCRSRKHEHHHALQHDHEPEQRHVYLRCPVHLCLFSSLVTTLSKVMVVSAVYMIRNVG